MLEKGIFVPTEVSSLIDRRLFREHSLGITSKRLQVLVSILYARRDNGHVRVEECMCVCTAAFM